MRKSTWLQIQYRVRLNKRTIPAEARLSVDPAAGCLQRAQGHFATHKFDVFACVRELHLKHILQNRAGPGIESIPMRSADYAWFLENDNFLKSVRDTEGQGVAEYKRQMYTLTSRSKEIAV